MQYFMGSRGHKNKKSTLRHSVKSCVPHLTPGDPTRVDNCALLDLPHKVAEVGGEEQHVRHTEQTEGWHYLLPGNLVKGDQTDMEPD